SQTGDVIGEADIYIAYGRYPQAIGLLLGVLENDADRNDVRLKLLELFVETNDREAFEAHMAELVDRCDDDDALLTAREFESRLGENDLEVGLSSEATPESDEVENELDELTDVDDFDLDLDADIDDGAALEELDQDDSIVEFDIGEDSAESPEADADQLIDDEPDVEALNSDDVNTEESFELELDEVEDLAEAEEGDLGSGDELGGDLGIDFNPDGNLTAESDDTVAEPVSGAAAVSTTADTLLTNKLEDTEFETEVATVEEDEFEFDDEGDSANTKLDLARAYIDMGDEDGARDILKEVLEEGSSDQQQQAQSILEGL
ncbi:MAG: FimV/HubP family polar landmark protein, partial [Pseudomonadales bacterium]